MEEYPVFGILLAMLFIAINAFFVLAEFAIVKVRASRVEELMNSGHPLAPLLAQRILPELDEYLSVTQIGITIASIALGWIGEPAIASLIEKIVLVFGGPQISLHPSVSFGIAFFLVSTAHVVLGELIPKTIAIRKADTMALWCARPLRVFYILFYPLLITFTAIANSVLTILGMNSKPQSSAHSPKELRLLLARSKDRGILDPQVFAIIDNAFSFRARTVREIMVTRDRVIVLLLSKSWRENRDLVRRYRHTRYPLCQTGIDDPIGLVHLKDVTLRSFSSNKETDLRRFRRELFELTPDTTLDRALNFLRARSAHMALVRNPGSPVEGIICMEDIVEQIVGRLDDEFDREEKTSVIDLLNARHVELVAEAKDKAGLFQKALEVVLKDKPELDPAATLAAIEHRETLFSTGIGEGIAIPHALLEDLNKPLLAVLRLKHGIDYHSIDYQPVRLVFLFLLPATNPGLRLRLFAEIAELLQKPGIPEKLLTVTNPEKFVEIVRGSLAIEGGVQR